MTILIPQPELSGTKQFLLLLLLFLEFIVGLHEFRSVSEIFIYIIVVWLQAEGHIDDYDAKELVLDGGFVVPNKTEAFDAPVINSFGNSFRFLLFFSILLKEMKCSLSLIIYAINGDDKYAAGIIMQRVKGKRPWRNSTDSNTLTNHTIM